MSTYQTRIEAMIRRASAGGNVALHGGPGSGKSHTAGLLADALRSESDMPCIRLDLSTTGSGAQVFATIATSLGRGTGPDTNVHDAWAALQVAGASADRTTCLVFDEFDSVVGFPDGEAFLRHLRELLHNSARSGFCAIVASRRNLRVIEECVRGISTLEGVFAPFHLSTLAKSDIETGWPLFNPSAPAWAGLLGWSGGVPRLIDLYVSSSVQVQKSSHDANVGRHEWVERQLDYLETVGLRDAAAQYVLGPIVMRDPAARARLLAMRVIGDADEADGDNGPPLASFEVFVTSLRARNAPSMDAWGPLGAAEAAARRLVRAILESVGVSAGAEMGILESWPPEVRHVLQGRESFLRICALPVPSLNSAVSALGLGDYWRVVDALWDRVGSSLSPPDRDYWRLRLSGLSGVGWAPDQRREVDTLELAKWTEEISAGRRLVEQRPTRSPLDGGWSGAKINVTAGKGAIVGIGQHVTGTAEAKSETEATDVTTSKWSRSLNLVFTVVAGLAGVGSLVYYLLDR